MCDPGVHQQEEGIGSAELIRRKASTQGEGTVVQISPQTAHREKEKEKEKDKDKAKKLTGISFKGKFPHSPSVRRKKPGESIGLSVLCVLMDAGFAQVQPLAEDHPDI